MAVTPAEVWVVNVIDPKWYWATPALSAASSRFLMRPMTKSCPIRWASVSDASVRSTHEATGVGVGVGVGVGEAEGEETADGEGAEVVGGALVVGAAQPPMVHAIKVAAVRRRAGVCRR
jgi:hypothetical protein